MKPFRSLPARLLLAFAALAVCTAAGYTYFRQVSPGAAMSLAGAQFVEELDAEQRKLTVMPYAAPERLDWHFIPKDQRKGLQVKNMTAAQRQAAQQLLQTALSEAGYSKATRIMHLENLLHELEAGKGRNIRDPLRYYFTLFGEPQETGRWGLSIEGHHLSLNFVVENGQVISSTPQFFAANPTVVKSANTVGIPLGTRVLAKEEELAFELANRLSPEQLAVACIAAEAPAEIRGAGSAQPPQEPAAGIAFSALGPQQQALLQELVAEYCAAMPQSVAHERLEAIREASWDSVHFAWAGALEPGIGHYYRVQGPTFLIEFVNTQPDAAGNPANHIHCVWRDMRGDFANPL